MSGIETDFQQIEAKLRDLSQGKDQIGTFSDGPHVRERINQDVRDIMKLSKSIKDSIATLQEQNESEASKYAAKFESLRMKMEPEINAVIQKLKNAQQQDMQAGNDGSVGAPLLSQSMIDDTSDQISILESEVASILKTMKEVKQLFDQAYEEINRQSHIIAHVDTLVEESHTNMVGGNAQLSTAKEHQKGQTKTLCWILLIVLVVIAAIVLIVFLTKK